LRGARARALAARSLTPRRRLFHEALFRHIDSLSRRGCHRTALEFCKLLLSLEPDVDPMCVMLCIDYHALKSGESAFLLQLVRVRGVAWWVWC